MLSILDILQTHGLFSAAVAAALLSALLLASASPALLLLGGRLAELASYAFGVWMDPRQRNLNRTGDHAHRAHVSQAPIIGPEAWAPGLALFAGTIGHSLGLWGQAPLARLMTVTQAGGTVALIAAATLATSLCLVLLSGAIGGWRHMMLGRLVIALRLAVMALAGILAWVSGFDTALLTGVATLHLLLRAPIMISAHGLRAYSVFMPLWLPFAGAAWLSTTLAVAFAGPALAILPPPLREGVSGRAIGAGLGRDLTLKSGISSIPRCPAIDTLAAVRHPS